MTGGVRQREARCNSNCQFLHTKDPPLCTFRHTLVILTYVSHSECARYGAVVFKLSIPEEKHAVRQLHTKAMLVQAVHVTDSVPIIQYLKKEGQMPLFL